MFIWRAFERKESNKMEDLNISDKIQQSGPVNLTLNKDEAANLSMILSLYQPSELQHLLSNNQPEGNKEKERISNRLNGFDPKNNFVWKEITQKFGSNIKQQELLSIATVIADKAKIKLDRDAKRRKTVLIKWFQENWDAIHPYFDYVVLEEAHH